MTYSRALVKTFFKVEVGTFDEAWRNHNPDVMQERRERKIQDK